MPEYRNPNAGGPSSGSSDSRSLIVSLIVMFAVIAGLQYWKSTHTAPVAPVATPAAAQQQQQPVAASTAPSLGSTPTPATAAADAAPAVQAAAETTTVVENELFRITFSNRGAEATSWILKKYKDSHGAPLDLVQPAAAKQFGYPLSLYTYDRALTAGLANALFVPSATGPLAAPASLTYKYSAGSIAVIKTFTFDETYVLHADTVVTQNGAPVRALLAWPGGFGDMETVQAYAGGQIDSFSGGKDTHDSFKKLSSGNTLNGPFDWAGTSDQYFAAIFLPDNPQTSSVVTLHNEIDVNKIVPAKDGKPAKPMLVPLVGAAMGDTTNHTQVRLFAGPKAVSILNEIRSANGETLKPLLDFGFFGAIGKYLFLALRAVHAAIAPSAANALTSRDWSWGWSIILLTIGINLILLPLRLQSMKSMLKMQRIQPQLDAIKRKFGNPGPTSPKSAEMNAEIMQFQKDNGVNMFGGCIPTLIQLPLLFAFFAMLTRVVELRQAHFMWLHDLSAADPFHILPIFMVLTSFLVQFYTPSPGVDPQQQRMMAFMMPLVSGFITWNYASGLALYWTIGNLIMILQQLVMNQTALGREMKQIQAERARARGAATNAKIVPPKVIQGKR